MMWKSYKERPNNDCEIIRARLLNNCGDEIEVTSTAKSFVWDNNKRSINVFTVDCWAKCKEGNHD